MSILEDEEPEELTYVCWGGRGAPGVAEGEVLNEGPQQSAGTIPSRFAAVLISQCAVEISPYDDGHCAL